MFYNIKIEFKIIGTHPKSAYRFDYLCSIRKTINIINIKYIDFMNSESEPPE